MDETPLEQDPHRGPPDNLALGYNHHGVYVGHGRVVHYSGLSGTGSADRSRRCRCSNS